MAQSKLSREIRDLLEPEGILSLTECRSLNAAEVDALLQSVASIRCIITSRSQHWATWLTEPDLSQRWSVEIRPMIRDHAWEGWYEASEWRTDKDEPLILFEHMFVPI